MRIARLLVLAFMVLGTLGAARKPALSVGFHAEANARDGEPFAMPVKFQNPERDGFVERIPSLSDRNIQAIYPVAAADGTFGCAFQLDQSGRIGLQTLSAERRGTSLVVFLSTKTGVHQVIDMVIDKPVNDGIIYVPRGLTQFEIAALQKQFRTMGQTKKRK